MKIASAFIISATVLLLTSCAEKSEPEQTEVTNTEAPAITAPVPGTSTPAPTGDGAAPTSTSAALNPAHGEPGHRCDISVGAPLSSTPQTPVQSPQQITTTVQPTVAPPVTQPSAPAPGTTSTGKVNPAHGEPGHDCSVAVGAPLK
jgi:hypothetical protein